MKRIILILAGFLLFFFSSSSGYAQRGEAYRRRNLPISVSPCWTKAYLEATPEQLKSLESLQRSFYLEISGLRNQYINLHYELRARMEHPQADIRAILEKQRLFSDLQKKMDEISIQYLLKARAIFTPEQLNKLPSGCNLGFNYGRGIVWDPMRSRGKRY
ncbi:MAG: Spy/CpxP family protein refolding chaperone [Thermodesulfobacteriota bacterium]